MKNLYPGRLNIRLVVSFLLVAMPSVLLMGYVTFTKVRASLQSLVMERLRQSVDLRQGELSRWIEDQIQDIVFLSSLPGFQENSGILMGAEPGSPEARAARDQLLLRTRYFQSGETEFDEILVLDRNGGRVVFSTDSGHEGDYRVSDEYFVRGLKGTFLQTVYLSPVTQRPTMTISTPLVNPREGFIGVLVANMNLDMLQQVVLTGSKVGNTSETFLVSGLNFMVSPSYASLSDYPRGVHSEGIDAVVKRIDGSGLYVNHRGVPVVGFYRWMEDLDLGILSEISQTEALAPARRMGWIITATGTLIFMAMALGIFMLARRISAPILRVRDAALQVSEGRMDVRVHVSGRGEVADLARSFNHMTEELGRLYRAIQQSETYFRTIFQTSPDPITVTRHSDGILLDVNQRVLEMFGYRLEELLTGSTSVVGLWKIPEERVRFLVLLEKQGHVADFEAELRRKDGTDMVCRISSRTLELDGQKVILSIFSDVTALRRAEDQLRTSVQEKEVLLKEIHHRVKNNLQVISGLLNLQQAHIPDPGTRAVYKESQSRIITMALIHESLYRTEDLSHVNLGLYLRNLAVNLFNSYGAAQQRVRLDFSVEEMNLVIDTAIPCGLIANELISNAIKHAFPDGRAGTVSVGLRRMGAEFELTVRDDGVGLPPQFDLKRSRSLGLQLVSLLIEQLGGSLQVDRGSGTAFTVTFREYHEAGTTLY